MALVRPLTSRPLLTFRCVSPPPSLQGVVPGGHQLPGCETQQPGGVGDQTGNGAGIAGGDLPAKGVLHVRQVGPRRGCCALLSLWAGLMKNDCCCSTEGENNLSQFVLDLNQRADLHTFFLTRGLVEGLHSLVLPVWFLFLCICLCSKYLSAYSAPRKSIFICVQYYLAKKRVKDSAAGTN